MEQIQKYAGMRRGTIKEFFVLEYEQFEKRFLFSGKKTNKHPVAKTNLVKRKMLATEYHYHSNGNSNYVDIYQAKELARKMESV